MGPSLTLRMCVDSQVRDLHDIQASDAAGVPDVPAGQVPPEEFCTAVAQEDDECCVGRHGRACVLAHTVHQSLASTATICFERRMQITSRRSTTVIVRQEHRHPFRKSGLSVRIEVKCQNCAGAIIRIPRHTHQRVCLLKENVLHCHAQTLRASLPYDAQQPDMHARGQVCRRLNTDLCSIKRGWQCGFTNSCLRS